MEQSLPYKLPTPPSSRPSSLRRPRRSLRGNIKTNTKESVSLQSELTGDKIIGDELHSENSDSNLYKYKILPAIGSQNSVNVNTQIIQDGTSGSIDMDGDVLEMVTKSQTVVKAAAGRDEEREIAVRLLDGSRHKHCFNSQSTLLDIVRHLRSVASPDAVPGNSEFVTCEVPCQVFTDLTISLLEANIKTKTLLHLKERDPD